MNLGKLVLNRDGVTSFDFDALGKIVRTAVRYLDRVIDVNFYPTPESAGSNSRWRPIGLGCMGLQDVFFQMRLPFDSEEALTLSTLRNSSGNLSISEIEPSACLIRERISTSHNPRCLRSSTR